MSEPSNSPEIYGQSPQNERSVVKAMKAGFHKKCPDCHTGTLFDGYTKVRPSCPSCSLDLTGQRADDAPPYFTMLIAGHLFIPLALEVKRHIDPPLAFQFLFFATLMLGFSIWFLPRVKGMLIGIQWANKMHGFSDDPHEDIEESLRA
ncbi:MAG: DUF983 domain-containing protein [bacterium]